MTSTPALDKDTPRVPTIWEIQELVAAHFGITVLDILSERRARRFARPRQVAMWIARNTTLHSLPGIGRHFGKRDHTTVMHGVDVVQRLVERDTAFAERVLGLKAALVREHDPRQITMELAA